MSNTPTKPINTRSSDSNCAVAKSRLDSIARTLVDNYAKWVLAEKQGMLLCRNIEAIKTKALEADSNVYPNNMKTYFSKLATITSIFTDITTNAQEALGHLYALNKLNGIDNEIFYRTWHLRHFIESLQALFECYEKESAVKQCVLRNLAHCTSRTELISCVSQWEYPQYVDDWTKLDVALLSEELKSNK